MAQSSRRRLATDSNLRSLRELVGNTAGHELSDVAGRRFRVSNLPLFTDVDGRAHQAIRVFCLTSPDAVERPVKVRVGAETVTTATLPFETDSSEIIWVPEVESASEAIISIGDADIDVTIEPQRKWTIHLIHHSHYDIGYTDPQSLVLANQLTYIDTALDMCTATDDFPSESQFRWTIEVAWPLRQWLRSRPASRREELVRRVREGRIEVAALPFSMHTEAYSFDELAHQLDLAQELRDTLGIEITTAMQTDVPGQTVGLASLLTDAGVDFLAVAHNYAGRSIPHLLDGQNLSRPFYWAAPDGEKVMVWYTDTLHGHAYMEAMTIGFGNGFGDVELSLPEYLNAVAQCNYPYPSQTSWTPPPGLEPGAQQGGYPHDILHLRVMGAFADNGPSSLLPAQIAREWNEQFTWPKLHTSTNRDFFEDAQERLGDQLETFSGDWTDWWADGIGSGASMLGTNRESQSAIRSAQTMNALAVALGDNPIPGEQGEVRTAYEDMALFDEHTWGAANPWDKYVDRDRSGERQWIRKAGFALAAEERVQSLFGAGVERLAHLARSADTAPGEPIAVFNPNSWSRTDLVQVFIPESSWSGEPVRLIEVDSGREVPLVITPQVHLHNRPKGVFIQFLASDVPPLGYVRYLLESGAPEVGSRPAGNPTTLESDHFAVQLDLERAAITSLKRQADGRELVDGNNRFGFGAYIHDRYTSAPGWNHLSSRLAPAQPWLLGSRGTGQYGVVTERLSNDVFEKVTFRQTAQGADWIETTLTLLHGAPRLHIGHRLHKPTTMEKESVYVAFPFAGENPRVTFEITGGVAGPDSPHVPGSARHFRAMRHWATIETDGADPVAWATSQAPLVQLGNIHIPYAPFPTTETPSPGTLYSWALNNIWDTNFPPQQGGEMHFDYVVASGGNDGEALGRDTGAAASQPLVGLRARPGTSASSLPDRGGFAEVADSRLEITHLASDGDGTLVVYLESHADEPVTTNLTFPGLDVTSAESASFLGTNRTSLTIADATVAVTVAPRAIQTVRLTLN